MTYLIVLTKKSTNTIVYINLCEKISTYRCVHWYTTIYLFYYSFLKEKYWQKRVSNRLNREEKAIRDPVPAGLIT